MSNVLTDAQKATFLAGYRQTFQMEGQGKALKALYADCSKQFGVPVDVLRRLLSKELDVHPKRYRALRNQRAARSAAKPAPEKEPQVDAQKERPVKRSECPACGQLVQVSRKRGLAIHSVNGGQCSGRVAPCKVCQTMQPVQHSTGRITTHYLPGAVKCGGSEKKPMELSKRSDSAQLCPVCGQKVRGTHNGTVGLHNAPRGTGWVSCNGTGLKIDPPKISDDRPDDRLDSPSIRTVSAGLGGLGRR